VRPGAFAAVATIFLVGLFPAAASATNLITHFGGAGSSAGNLSSPSDVAIDSEGNAWVVDTGHGRIQQFDAEGEFVRQFSAVGSGTIGEPRALAVDSEDNLYVATNGGLYKFDSEGAFLEEIGESGSGDGQFQNLRGVAIDAEDHIWTVQTPILSPRVQHFDPEGEFVAKFGVNGSEDGQMKSPEAIAIDAEGDVWIADTNNDRVQRFSPEGEFISKFGTAGSEEGQLSRPRGIAIDAEGDIWVADSGNNRIQRFSPEGEFLSGFGTPGNDPGQLKNPKGLDLDGEGSVWVADSGNDRVQGFDPEAQLVLHFGGAGSSAGNLSSPSDVAIDSEGNAWVVDTGHGRIQQFDAEGEFVRQFSAVGSGTIGEPRALAVDSEDNLYVATNGGLYKFDSEGAFLEEIGESGSGDGQFQNLRGVAIDAEDHIWTVQTPILSPRVQHFDPEGEFVAKFGVNGSEDGQMKSPEAIAIDAEGDVWIADTNNDRVQRFSPEGEFISKFGTAGSEEGQLSRPRGIAIDAEGDIWVADSGNNRIQRFSPEGEFLSGFGTPGNDPGQLKNPKGLDLDGEGSVWVADSGNDRVQGWEIGEAPTVATEVATGVFEGSATLKGSVDPNGAATSYWFEFTDQEDFEANGFANATSVPATPAEAGAGAKALGVGQLVEGLEAATAYRFRAAAESSFGTVTGESMAFTTWGAAAPGSPPGEAYRFSYDADGRLITATDPEGDTATYQWDAAGNLTGIDRDSSEELAIHRLAPGSANVGETIEVRGTGFSPESNTVKFNGAAATVEEATRGSLSVVVPEGAESGPVTVSTPAEGPVSSPEEFTVGGPAKPTISEISPTVAAAGEVVTITGANLDPSPAANLVEVNGAAAVVTAATSTTVKFKVPTERLGGRVSVTTIDGSATGPDLFIPPNGAASSTVGATGRVEPGGSETMTIATPETDGLLLVDGVAGQRMLIDPNEDTFTGSFDVRRPNGGVVSGSTGNLTSIHGPFTLPEDGTYTIKLTGSGEQTGSVELAAYTFDDVTGSITPTVEGEEESVSITVSGQRALYSVEVEAGQAVSVKTSNADFSAASAYFLRWRNSAGTQLAGTLWWGKTGSGFWKQQEFPEAGTYTLEVDPDYAMTGSVDLTLWDSSDKTGETIAPSAEGDSKTFSVDIPGQNNLITFEGEEDQKILIDPNEDTFTGSFDVRRPNGGVVSGSTGNLTSIHGPFTLPEDGTYTIKLTGSGEATGSVELAAYDEGFVAFGAPEIEYRLASFDGIAPDRDDESRAPEQAGSAGPRDGAAASERAKGGTATASAGARARSTAGASLRRWRPAHRGSWLPPKNSDKGRGWVAGRSASPWLDVPQRQAPDGETALAGQALHVNGLPLAGVRVSIEGSAAEAVTDDTGRFLLRDVPAGHQQLLVDGEAIGGQRYGAYEVGIDLRDAETTELDYTMWLTPLDRAGDLKVASPTEHGARLKSPRIPGLEVRIPAGTVIRDADGEVVTDLNITAIPVDRPQFPLPPFVSVPIYFTVQPGRATLTKGVQFVYPNWAGLRPGQRVDFWNYDPEDRGWYVYGQGSVTPDGDQIVPDAGVRVWEFSGAMAISSPPPPGEARNPDGSSSGGDPVDLYTGLFTYHRTDLTIPDTIPISIERTYRPKDGNSYDFGIGTTSLYDLRLWSNENYKQADLVLPDGGKIHYVRTSEGTGYVDAIYETSNQPTPFAGSEITWNTTTGNWDLELKNGTTFSFSQFTRAPLMGITDAHGNKLTINRSGDNITKVVTPNGRWAEFTYDGSNRVTEITDNGGRVFKYTYTSGRLTKVEEPGERSVEYEYDGSGRMSAITNPRGNKFLQNTYDANGRVETQTTGDEGVFEFDYELDEEGNVEATTVTDPVGNERVVEFNAEGLPIAETEAPGAEIEQTTSFERQEETGLVLSETDELGRKTSYEYDSVGNVTEITQLDGTEDAVTTAFEYEAGTSYLTKVTDPLGHESEFEHGPGGELVKATDALENETMIEYDGSGKPLSFSNAEEEETTLAYVGGDLASVTDPLGRTTTRFTDALGRLRAVTSPGGDRTLYSYNDSDELTAITTPSGAVTALGYDKDGNVTSVTDPRENETTVSYDVMDRVVGETDPLENASERSYDKAGHLVESVDRNGDATVFGYDELGRLASVSYGVEGESAESTTEYGYDDADRLVSVDDSASGEYGLEYDGLDRLTEVSGPEGTVGYVYDDGGRRTAMTLPNQDPVGYEYDDANRLTEIARGFEAVSLTYDDAGRRTAVTLPNGIDQIYDYDAASQLTSMTYMDGESTLGDLRYGYDADGRTSAIWGSYARLDLPEALESAKYNAANQLTERDGAGLSYDANGSLVDDEANEYSWNARGQLTEIDGAASATFAYDPFGRRTSKTIGEATTGFLHDGDNVVQEYSGEELSASLLTGLGLDDLFSRASGEGADSLLTDHLGSVIGLADGSKEVATTYSYEPFGAASSAGEPSANPFQFTGRENDGTGLQFNRARYYSPDLARFTSQDPAGFAGSGTNLYWYADSRPFDLTDPTGECPSPPIPCAPSIPNPAAPLEDLAEGALNNLKESGRQIGDWVSDSPEVASEVADYLLGSLSDLEKLRATAGEALGGAICGFAWAVAAGADGEAKVVLAAAAKATCAALAIDSAFDLGTDLGDDD